MLEESKRILTDLIAMRLATNFSARSALEQQHINGGLQEQIQLIERDEPATVRKIAELRLIAEGDAAADSLELLLDECLALKVAASAALLT